MVSGMLLCMYVCHHLQQKGCGSETRYAATQWMHEKPALVVAKVILPLLYLLSHPTLASSSRERLFGVLRLWQPPTESSSVVMSVHEEVCSAMFIASSQSSHTICLGYVDHGSWHRRSAPMCKLRGFSRRTAKHSTIDFKVTVWPVRDNSLLGFLQYLGNLAKQVIKAYRVFTNWMNELRTTWSLRYEILSAGILCFSLQAYV
jgi:hypothetical protein